MAKASYREGLRLWQKMQQVEQRLGIVKGLAWQRAAAQGQAERAGRLFGAASRLLPATSTYREEVHRRSAAAPTGWATREQQGDANPHFPMWHTRAKKETDVQVEDLCKIRRPTTFNSSKRFGRTGG